MKSKLFENVLTIAIVLLVIGGMAKAAEVCGKSVRVNGDYDCYVLANGYLANGTAVQIQQYTTPPMTLNQVKSLADNSNPWVARYNQDVNAQ